MGRYNESQRKASAKYMKKNSLSIAFRLSKIYEQDLIAIYKSIPDSQKAAFFKQALREYDARRRTKPETE